MLTQPLVFTLNVCVGIFRFLVRVLLHIRFP
jgi:hypothetical protein